MALREIGPNSPDSEYLNEIRSIDSTENTKEQLLSPSWYSRVVIVIPAVLTQYRQLLPKKGVGLDGLTGLNSIIL